MNQQQMTASSLHMAGMKLTILNGKNPILKDWPNNPVDLDTIMSHTGNFGVICGDGFFVFDVDNLENFMTFLVERELEFPNDTYTVQTAKGYHFYYRLPQGMSSIRNSVRVGKTSETPAGFADLRGTGGQVVAESGIHPDTGAIYTCIEAKPIAECPQWLVALLADHNVGEAHTGKRGEVLIESDDIFATDRAVRYLTTCEPAIEFQGGDNQTFAVAARCRDYGLSEQYTLQLMLEHFNPRCEPPWTPDEMAVKVSNAYAHAASPQGNANPIGSFMASGFLNVDTPEQVAPAPVVPSAPVTADTQPPAVPRTDIVSGIDPYDITVGCGYSKNHTENASRFIAENYPGDTLRFHNDTWYIFSGKHWYNPDMSSQPGTAIKRGVTIAMLNATPSNSDINGTVGVIEKICSRPKDLGAFGNRTDVGSLLLVENGILNVSTGQLEPHNPDFFSTNLLPFAYSPDAQCPTWDRFLADVTEGDLERIQFIEEWLGYMMVRDYSFQKIAMFIGVQRSGKTTIANIAKRLVGANNYAGLGLEGFAQDGTLESALDKTVLWVGDAGTISGPQRSTIVDRLKTISGNGDLSVGRKYKSAFNGRMPGRIAITCNNVLQFSDDSGALAGRFIICPFNKSFFGQEDPQLENKLAAELPGIANRCIKALQRLRSRGHFVEPSIASSDRDSITSRYSPILSFLTDECVVGPEERVHNQNLYARYKMWVARNGHKALAYNNFVDAVRTATRGKTTKGPTMIEGIQLQGFRGISLKPDEQPENVSAFPQQGVR